MKKTNVLSVILLAAALIFASCDNASNSGSGGGSSGSSNNPYSDFPEMDVSEFSDCTVDTNSLEIQNGTNWSLRFMQYGEPSSRSAENESIPFTLEMDITTQYVNNDFTFTSGKFTQTMKTSDCMDEDGYNQYKGLSDQEKDLYKAMFLGILAAAFEQSGYGTLLDGEINEDYIRIVYSLSDTYLQLLEDTFKEAINSSDTSLKTNSGKNKYIVVSDGNDFYMKKL